MARVTVLTQFFPPETNPAVRRVIPMLDALSRSHEVTVTTLRPSYPSPALYANGAAAASDARLPYRVRRTTTFHPHTRLLPLRALREQLMAARLMLAAMRDRTDVVFATSPSMFLGPAGWALARTKRARFVLDLRDLHWRLARELADERIGRVTGIALRALERYMWWVVRRADLVVNVTRGNTALLVAEGVSEDRILTIPNTISQEILDELAPCAEVVPKDRPVCAYVGLIGYSQGLEDFVDAARQVPEVDFVIGGDGSFRAELEERARGLENVRFTGYLDRVALVDFYRESDILFVQTRGSEYTNTSIIPIKLYEYMAASRPIAYAGAGLAVELLHEAGSAVTVPPGDSTAIAGAVRELAHDPARRQELGRSGRAFVERSERREQSAERLVAAVERLLAS
jgi:putative colanic acid biosynthesis glycosyltransferase WcaI